MSWPKGRKSSGFLKAFKATKEMIAIQPRDSLRKTSFRLTPEQWRRVKDEALDENGTMNQLLVAGLNLWFTAKGEEPLDPDCPIKPPKRKTKRGDA
jgi:hypothetical protein